MRLNGVHGTTVQLTVVCLAVIGLAHAGAPSTAATNQGTAQVADGQELFLTHCASCHGASGTGNGPAAASLRRTPRDLTALALTNGSVFPTERLHRIIDGRDIESHGDRDMPVWGDAFKMVRGGQSEESVRARIASILRYLMSIQRRQA